MSREPIKLAAVGGRRAQAFDRAVQALADRVQWTAICDPDETMLARWQTHHPGIQAFTRLEDLLERGDCDAVLLATPLSLHAAQAIQALAADKHVLSEVPAIRTLDEGWALIEAVERSDRVYMMAENYCYLRENRLVLGLARDGQFGEITYAEGAYIHDCRALLFSASGELTWRGLYRRDMNGNSYPTHSLGPVAQWMGINRTDRLVSTATWMTREEAVHRYAAEILGADHPAAQPGHFRHGDSATTLIRTERGALIVLRVDWASPRPHNMTHYALQGTRGAYLSARHPGEDPLIWLDGLSPGASPPEERRGEATWEPLWRYANLVHDDLWSAYGSQAASKGHGGGDFLVFVDFLHAIEKGTPPAIDVYDAVTWSAIIPLSEISVQQGGAPVAIPDFRRDRGAP